MGELTASRERSRQNRGGRLRASLEACPCGCNCEATAGLFAEMPDEELLFDVADLFKAFRHHLHQDPVRAAAAACLSATSPLSSAAPQSAVS